MLSKSYIFGKINEVILFHYLDCTIEMGYTLNNNDNDGVRKFTFRGMYFNRRVIMYFQIVNIDQTVSSFMWGNIHI